MPLDYAPAALLSKSRVRLGGTGRGCWRPGRAPPSVTRRATPVNRGWRPTGQVMVRACGRVVPFISNIAGMRLEWRRLSVAHGRGDHAGRRALQQSTRAESTPLVRGDQCNREIMLTSTA